MLGWFTLEEKRTPQKQNRVERHVEKNQCLHISKDGHECTEPMCGHGLCKRCDMNLANELRKLSPEDRLKVRRELWRRGEFLENGEQRRLRRQCKSVYASMVASATS